jgi:tetratricopeptide (TPR) repeat protein
MQIRKIILLATLCLTGICTIQAQKTVVSKKHPITLEQPTALVVQGDLIALGDSCMELYDTHAALAYYQQAYKEKQTYETRQKLANCLYQRCDYKQCISLLSEIPVASMTHDAMRQLFFSYGYLKNDNQLVNSGLRLLKRFPMDAEVLARLCTVLCDQDKAGEAVVHARVYCQRDSTNLLINRTLANALYLDRQFRPAIEQYKKLLAAGDTTFLGLYSTGMAYDYLGNKQEAYQYLGMALKRNEKSPGCHYRFGVICIDLQRYEEGLDHLYQAEYLMQPDKTILKVIADHKGKAYYGLQNYDMATEAWKTARKYDGSSLAFIFNIGSSYAALYEQNKAKMPEYEQVFLDKGTSAPELEQAKSYYSMFLEMALDSDEELEEETKQMVKEAQEYLEMYKP